jgi:site-specific recombinase XerD
MSRAYTGPLSAHISGLIAEKRASGHPYESPEETLREFDSFTEKGFPEAVTLTREMAYAWAQRRKTEGANRLLNRISLVRQLALHMNRMDTPAFVIDAKGFARKERPRHYVLTHEELASFFCGCDAYLPSARSPLQALVVQALFRAIYCLGLRPCEALRLDVGDVDLSRGAIDIYQSKGDKDRTVYMSEDLRGLLAGFDKAMSAALPEREAFFSNGSGGHWATESARRWFTGIWRSSCAAGAEGTKVPSMMSLRHTFATERIRLWAAEGKDLRSAIYYLVVHMGHRSICETERYLHLTPLRFSEMLSVSASFSEGLFPEVV